MTKAASDRFVSFAYITVGQGRVTAAIAANSDNTIEVGATICSPQDRFVKARGREIASSRLFTKDGIYAMFVRSENETVKAQVTRLLKVVISEQYMEVPDLSEEVELDIRELNVETLTPYEATYEDGSTEEITVCNNAIPGWARRAVLNHQTY